MSEVRLSDEQVEVDRRGLPRRDGCASSVAARCRIVAARCAKELPTPNSSPELPSVQPSLPPAPTLTLPARPPWEAPLPLAQGPRFVLGDIAITGNIVQAAIRGVVDSHIGKPVTTADLEEIRCSTSIRASLVRVPAISAPPVVDRARHANSPMRTFENV
jgi:hypothetical protein